MPVNIGNVPPSSLQTTANPAATTLTTGNIVDIILSDAITAAPSTALTIEHGTSGTPIAAANATSAFGVRIEFKLDDTVNVKQLAGTVGAYWRAVNSAIGGDSGVISIMPQSSGTLVEYRFNDYAFQTVNGSTTNPSHGFTSDNRHGMTLDGSSRVAFAHTSVVCMTMDSSAGAPRIGIGATTPAVISAIGATLTNNVTAGGTANTIANYTDLTVYANDAAAIRNDIYQLALKLATLEAGLKLNNFTKT